ncbi:MAG: acyl-CoA dehydrogenase family protein [Deltaproteobacteria bacterium]|nr:acyl-CoA dehydrogenase family protein [Deltaproteobacteria bacterium]
MQFELTDEDRMIQDAARDFAQRAVAPGAAQRDRDEEFPADIVRQLGELGFLGVKIGDRYGGAGANNVGYVLALREMARACAATAVAMAVTNMVADAIEMFGSDEQRDRWLKPLMRGDLCAAAFCLSEPEVGSDSTALRTTARRDGDCYLLNGTKSWVSSGPHAGLNLIFATLDRSQGARAVTAFVVEPKTPGLTIARVEDKMGLRGSETAQYVLEDARVPVANRLAGDGEGMKIALGVLDGGRIGIGAQSVGVGEAALAEGVRYAKMRKAFGQEIAGFQALQWMIADTATELEAAWLLTLRAASLRDTGQRVSREASMAKVFSSEACGRAVDRMLQIHGGYGYTRDYPIERLYRDARVFRIYEGTSEVQRLVIARALLKEQ